MANVFRISPLNSFRWRKKDIQVDPRYNSLPFDDVVDQNCYFAKWQTNDRSQVQVLSDYIPTLVVKDYYDNSIIEEIPLPEIEFNLVGVSFKCYQAEIVWALFDEGDYYCEISYNDGSNDIVYQTSPLSVRDEWSNTVLFEVRNRYNDKDIIFDTGIIINFRIEGMFRNYLPKSENQLYIDQKYNVTQESSTPYRNFTLFIGGAAGLPGWAIDKCNLLFSVDQKQINGVYYEKAEEGTTFEVGQRPEIGYNDDAWWSLAIVETYNKDIGDAYLTEPNTPSDNDLKMVRDSRSFLDTSDNLTVSGLFTKDYVWDYLSITNKSLAPFTLRVGTTNGGAEIAEEEISEDLTSVVTIRHRFETATTVYLTGIADVNLDLWACYDFLSAPVINPPVSGEGGFVRNTIYWYIEEQDGDFERDWNVGTGLGNPGTKFEKCAMLDGRNTMVDATDSTLIAWNRNNPTERQTFVGGNEQVLTMDNLPADGVLLFTNDVNSTSGDTPTPTSHVARAKSQATSPLNYEMVKGYATNYVGKSANLGIGAGVDVRQKSLVTVPFIKITD